MGRIEPSYDSTISSLSLTGKAVETIILNNPISHEIAHEINYTTNKSMSGNDTGLKITMTDTASPGTSIGLHCLHGSNTILAVHNGNERVGIGTMYPDRLLQAELATSQTSSVQYPLRLTHITSGTPAAGIGVGLEFEQEIQSGTNEVIATIDAEMTSVTQTYEDTDLVFSLMANGSVQELFRFVSDGKILVTPFATGSAPAYVEGGLYYDSTLHKMRIGGASGWETVTSG